MGLASLFLRTCFFIIVVLVVVALIPGLPPRGKYEVLLKDPPLPLDGPLAPNSGLDEAVRLFENQFTGPESIASRGRSNEIFLAMHGGTIVKVYGPDYSKHQEVAKIGPGCRGPWEERVCGRPLGIRFAKDGRLLLADAYLGIFKVNVDTGEKQRLLDPTATIEGELPLFINDLDEDSQGNIYWSHSSTLGDLTEGFLETIGGPSGRLLKLDAKTGQSVVLLDDLHFANGVQLSPQQDFVLVAETLSSRVIRYWLKGAKSGTHDVFIAGLPGFPDNIRPRPQGGYYVPLVMVNPADPAVDVPKLMREQPWLRRLIGRVLYAVKKVLVAITDLYDNEYTARAAYAALNTGLLGLPYRHNHSILVELDPAGNVASSLQGNSGTIAFISQAEQVGDRLFFGSPYNKFLGMLPLSKVRGEQEPASVPKTGSKLTGGPKKEGGRKESVTDRKEEL